MINIVCTSKPCDGLFYYSCEYAILLKANIIVITHPGFTPVDYINAASEKYTVDVPIVFDDYDPLPEDLTFVLGRSMITLPFLNWSHYKSDQLLTLHMLFGGNLLVVYSENHVNEYPLALQFFKPKSIRDLCDKEVYPAGSGDHFEKTINFSIYKDPVDDKQFEHLFIGTNERYYKAIQKCIDQYPSHGIITYNDEYIDKVNNNIFAPVTNLLGLFGTYVYTKDYFDPAPRLIQECKYYGKEIIYHRSKNIIDGGSVYYNREIQKPDVSMI